MNPAPALDLPSILAKPSRPRRSGRRIASRSSPLFAVGRFCTPPAQHFLPLPRALEVAACNRIRTPRATHSCALSRPRNLAPLGPSRTQPQAPTSPIQIVAPKGATNHEKTLASPHAEGLCLAVLSSSMRRQKQIFLQPTEVPANNPVNRTAGDRRRFGCLPRAAAGYFRR